MAPPRGGTLFDDLTVGDEADFLSDPRLLKHYSLLQDLGILPYIAEIRRGVRDYERLLGGASEIFKQTSIDEMIDAAIRCVTDRFLPSLLVFLWRPRSGRDDLSLVAYRNLQPADVDFSLESLSPFEPFFRNHPEPIGFELFEHQFAHPDLTAPFAAVSPEIVVPVVGPSGLYGLILVGKKVLDGEYSGAELSFIDKLMSFLAVSIQNNLHYEHSVRDVKTGLYNHGFFMGRLQEEVARGRRSDYSFSVIVLDVDLFKSFNDRYGHLAGDRILEGIAEILTSAVRDLDVPARFGGEEFTVLLPEAGREQAWAVSERLRTAVEALRVPWEEPLSGVTISAGVAVSSSSESLDAEQLLTRADQALYLSKRRGRNRSTVWGSGLLSRCVALREGMVGKA